MKKPEKLPQIKVDIGKPEPYPTETITEQSYRILQRNNRARRNGQRARGT